MMEKKEVKGTSPKDGGGGVGGWRADAREG